MFDINFYMNIHDISQKILGGETFEKDFIIETFERFRSKEPVIYNIETTNACNMRCTMCPRTTKMTRKVKTLDLDTFKHIVEQIRPWNEKGWAAWESFVEKKYQISANDMSENHFFLYIIPKVIQLHGYGDPLLDKNMHENVRILSEKGFYSYFSCNPANIDIDRTIRMFDYGLDYIKYSIESVDDERHKEIRGQASNFSESYKKILQLLDIKDKKQYQTIIIITMLDLNNEWQEEEFMKLKEAFQDLDVYIYLKSEDQQWYRKEHHGTNSIHWSEICKHPWMSMTVKSDGAVAMCMEDYNNEIILGDVRSTSLYDIWNGEKYRQFRNDHFNNKPVMKCSEECDMTVVGTILK